MAKFVSKKLLTDTIYRRVTKDKIGEEQEAGTADQQETTPGKKKSIVNTIIYCAVIMIVFKVCSGINADNIENYRAISRQEMPRPVTEKEVQAAVDNLQPSLDNKQAEAEEWFRLNESSPGGGIRSKLLPDKNHSFRGLSFGMTADQVKAHEAGRLDTLLSPVPQLRPDDQLTYWYYIEDGEVGFLFYHFNSAGRLNNIMITFQGPPLSEPEAIDIMNALVPAFSATLGTPKKHSDYTYEWSLPTLQSAMFAFPSSRPAESTGTELAIIYAPPNSFRNMDINELREEMIKTENRSWEMLERALLNENKPGHELAPPASSMPKAVFQELLQASQEEAERLERDQKMLRVTPPEQAVE